MKRNILKIQSIILSAVLFVACGDEQQYFTDITTPSSGAYVKFLHAASDSVRVVNGATSVVGVNFFLDGDRVTATGVTTEYSPTEMGYAGAFPSTNYAVFQPGTYQMEVIVPERKVIYLGPPVNTVPYLQKIMLKRELIIDADKYYTVAYAGVFQNYEPVVIDDSGVEKLPLDGKAYIRFVNLIHNSTGADLLGVEVVPAAGNSTVLADYTGYKSSTGFLAVIPGDYTLKLFNATTRANVATGLATSTGRFVGNKVYTLYARGQIGGATPKAPAIDRMVNR